MTQTTPSLAEFYETIVALAKKMFADLGYVKATYICVDKDGTVFPIPPPPVPNELVPRIMRAFFQAKNIVLYGYMDEAWMLDEEIYKNSDDPLAKIKEELEKYGSVHEHPNRIECVHIIVEQGLETMTGSFKIIRSATGSKSTLESMGEPSNRATGRFTGLLMPHKTQH